MIQTTYLSSDLASGTGIGLIKMNWIFWKSDLAKITLIWIVLTWEVGELGPEILDETYMDLYGIEKESQNCAYSYSPFNQCLKNDGPELSESTSDPMSTFQVE